MMYYILYSLILVFFSFLLHDYLSRIYILRKKYLSTLEEITLHEIRNKIIMANNEDKFIPLNNDEKLKNYFTNFFKTSTYNQEFIREYLEFQERIGPWKNNDNIIL